MNVLSLFDGISCGQQALLNAGINIHTYYASEIDPVAIEVTQSNFPDTVQLGDVSNVHAKTLPCIDLVMGGSPCQGFSRQGKGEGFSNQASSLYIHYIRLLKETRAKWFLLENVTMKPEHINRITTDLGVAPIQLNSRYWVPHNRERLYWTNIPFTLNVPRNMPSLSSMVGKGYEGVYAPPHGYFKGGFKEQCDVAPCVTRTGWLSSFFVVQHGKRRKFTLQEVETLQGVPKDYTVVAGSNSARVRLLGNAWTVPVVSTLLSSLTHVV